MDGERETDRQKQTDRERERKDGEGQNLFKGGDEFGEDNRD